MFQVLDQSLNPLNLMRSEMKLRVLKAEMKLQGICEALTSLSQQNKALSTRLAQMEARLAVNRIIEPAVPAEAADSPLEKAIHLVSQVVAPTRHPQSGTAHNPPHPTELEQLLDQIRREEGESE